MTRAACALIALAVASCGAAAWADAPRERPAKPGQEFGGKAMLVRAPSSEGWVVRETANDILFGHRGAAKNETYVATVTFFELPEAETKSAEAFTAFIRAQTAADLPAERFADPTASYEYTEARGYPCVKYVGSAIDKKAPGGPLRQTMVALYCQYTRRAGMGYAAIYSQRAKQIDADLAQQAETFLEGVRVPKE
jgi:hypothetical protein